MGSTASYSTSYTSVVTGTPDTESYKVYIKDKSSDLILSSVHDIPLKPKDSPKNVYNMVVEVPRWSNAKLEVSKKHDNSTNQAIKQSNKVSFFFKKKK